ncbi:tetratricopeptide repeat protein, partial [Flavobacteriaceae bacterium]|nr:tetratricopeptide repeat protein [Flavobacteriaceae bacterium]
MKNIIYTIALVVSFSSFGQTAEEYFNSGYDKDEVKDFYGAISDYTKAIELDPNYANAYNNRGILKNKLKDYYGAISDYTKVIELKPNFAIA